MIKFPISLLEFQQGRSPKESLNIGLANQITSEDLELAYVYRDEFAKSPYESIKNFIILSNPGNPSKDFILDTFKRAEKISEFIGNKIRFDEYYDNESNLFDKVSDYMNRYSDSKLFVYDYYPHSPYCWAVCFSEIKFPNAEEIKWEEMGRR